MALIGYARISTSEGRQLLDRQLDALQAAGTRGQLAAVEGGEIGALEPA